MIPIKHNKVLGRAIRQRSAMAMLIVMMLLAVGTIIGASLLAESSLSAVTSRGIKDSVNAEYLAESALEHAACLLRESPDTIIAAGNGELGPYTLGDGADQYSFSVTKLATPGYFSVSAYSAQGAANRTSTAVYRHTWGRQVKINHALVSTGSSTAYTAFGSEITGDVHSNFIFYHVGYITGDLSASCSVTSIGSVHDGSIVNGAASVAVPSFDPDNYVYYAWKDKIGEAWIHDDNYFNEYEDVRDRRSITEENPAGVVIVRPTNGYLQISSEFDFEGTLIIEGDLLITGDKIDLKAFYTFPALIVTGGIYFRNNAEIEIDGVVYTADGMYPYNSESYDSESYIRGALICDKIGYYPYLRGTHKLTYDESYCSLIDPTGYGTGGKIAIYDWSR